MTVTTLAGVARAEGPYALASVAVQVTVVTPRPTGVPLAGSHVTDGVGSTTSVAVGAA